MSTTTKPMSQKEYLARDGGCCPFCKSVDIEGGSVEINAGVATQEVMCNECDAEWEDTYVLTGFQV
jgi:hypothetical protein